MVLKDREQRNTYALFTSWLGNPSVRFTQARKSNIARVYWQDTITLLPEITLAGLELTWSGLFERWIPLSTGKITIQRIAWFVLLILIHWIAIYPVDRVIQPLDNWSLVNSTQPMIILLKKPIILLLGNGLVPLKSFQFFNSLKFLDSN